MSGRRSAAPVAPPCVIHGTAAGNPRVSVTRHAQAGAAAQDSVKRTVSSTRSAASKAKQPEEPVAVSDSVQSNQAYQEYIHNLQQQVYFLELEAQMLKHKPPTVSGSGEGGDFGAFASDGTPAGSFDEIFTQVCHLLTARVR